MLAAWQEADGAPGAAIRFADAHAAAALQVAIVSAAVEVTGAGTSSSSELSIVSDSSYAYAKHMERRATEVLHAGNRCA